MTATCVPVLLDVEVVCAEVVGGMVVTMVTKAVGDVTKVEGTPG